MRYSIGVMKLDQAILIQPVRAPRRAAVDRRMLTAVLLTRVIGEVVRTDDHVLCRRHQRTTMSWAQDVVRTDSIKHAGLGLRFGGQRQVNSHLVTVEVGVERRANERVDLDGLALDQHRLERLDAETMQASAHG